MTENAREKSGGRQKSGSSLGRLYKSPMLILQIIMGTDPTNHPVSGLCKTQFET